MDNDKKIVRKSYLSGKEVISDAKTMGYKGHGVNH
jgi:hypothetical protein